MIEPTLEKGMRECCEGIFYKDIYKSQIHYISSAK